MRRVGIAACAAFVLLALFPAMKALEPQTKVEALDSAVLGAEDKNLLQEALRLKRTLGDDVWPGLASAAIPVVIYNDRYEFLVGHPSPPDSWTKVENDDFDGQAYFRRAADDPQAFAVRVGEQWAGSMSTLERINRKAPFKIAADFYVVLFLHEVFHAFQANEAPLRFERTLALYAMEKNYPAKDPGFIEAWDTEGSLLAAALRGQDRVELDTTTKAFLRNRQDRRAQVPLSASVADYERELEWLEGLAKYVEMRFYELAEANSGASTSAKGSVSYRSGLPYWTQDFARLEKAVGSQRGDLRFYLSGMAQARILDRLTPGWKQRFLQDGGALEDLLAAFLETGQSAGPPQAAESRG